MPQWRQVFAGEVGGRSVQVEILGDGEAFRVRTTQARDFADAAIAHVRSAGEQIDLVGETLGELKDDLLANDFSEADARELVRHAKSYDPIMRFAFEFRGDKINLQGQFGDGSFTAMRFFNGSTRMVGTSASDQPRGGTVEKTVVATSYLKLQTVLGERYPGYTGLRQF